MFKTFFKKFEVIALFALISTSVFAGDLDCGYKGQKIPAALLEGLRNPGCIALDSELQIAVVAGEVPSARGSSTEVRAISIALLQEPKLISSIGLSDQVSGSIPYLAFARTCGLPLSTARVASTNEVVLIYDLLDTETALIWNFSARNVAVITSDFDPKQFHFCNGKALGIDNDLENIAFDRDGRTIALRGIKKGSTTVRASF